MARGVPYRRRGLDRFNYLSLRSNTMSWTKPEAEVVAVTMEVTAYVATL